MKIEPVHSPHHDVCNFVVSSENAAEEILLRNFCRAGQNQRLFMHSYGGTYNEYGPSPQSFCFGWRKESDFVKVQDYD